MLYFVFVNINNKFIFYFKWDKDLKEKMDLLSYGDW